MPSSWQIPRGKSARSGFIGVWLTISAALCNPGTSNAGDTFLETIGISTAAGVVLGASTLSFYEKPGSHLLNIVYGASVGAALGVGVAVYSMFQEGVKDPELKEEEELEESLTPTSSLRFHWLRPTSHRITSAIARAQENGFLAAPSAQVASIMHPRGVRSVARNGGGSWLIPVVSITW